MESQEAPPLESLDQQPMEIQPNHHSEDTTTDPLRGNSICDNAANVYNILHQTILGNLPLENTIQNLKKSLETTDDKQGFQDLLTDATNHCDIETSITYKDSRERFLNLVKELIRSDILPRLLAFERFEYETNAQVGVIQDKRLYTVTYNRLRTKLYFKQKKYNLLREQNEGFAKILAQLSKLNRDNTQEVQEAILELIGAYYVDPNRVVDIVLSVFQHNSEYEDCDVYLDFIKSFYRNTSRILKFVILKLTFYSSTKDVLRQTPDNFYRMLALLIQRSIIDIDDIYAYLLPEDGKILEHHQKLVEEGRELSRRYAMAVLGGSEEKSPPKSVVENLRDENPIDYHRLEVDNHKINLCTHLIAIGDWTQASYLAEKLPQYYCYSNRPTAETLCSYINYIIDPLYRECALPKPLNLKIRPASSRYYKPSQQVTKVEELGTKLIPILLNFGPFLGADTLIVTKVIRVLTHALHSPVDPEGKQTVLSAENDLYYKILDATAYSILPAASLSRSNCCLARELWSLVRNFKYHIRYKLYHEWKDDSNNPIMLKNKGQILLRAKHHMKRLSKETLRPSGRNLGKLCYQHPVITLNYIITQIISYDNLISLVVDALRFLPPIALDSLIYCIIEALSDPHKNKKSLDGMALAQWLTNISTFSSSIISRYRVEFISFLEYIANQLKIGNSLDLVLLTDLIQKMTGIETIQTITDERLEALLGGDVLRTEGAYYNQVKNTRKTSARLKEALVESKLAMPLCILIAQLRDNLFFSQESSPLKLVGKLYDQCQETFVQYGVFLSMNLNIDDYVNFLPPLEKLMTDHRLDPDTAFFLARPMIFHKIKSRFIELKNEAIINLPAEEGETPELSAEVAGAKFIEAAKSIIDPIAETIQPILAQKYTSCNLNCKLFVIFWTLSMSDIEVPLSCYEREIARLKAHVNDLTKSPEDDPKKRKEKDRCANLIHKLKSERAEQVEHVKYIKMYLESERNNLFCDNSSHDNVYLESRQFVQHCPFARCIQTACDAIYSARFMLFLHELKVENYPTIICLDRLLCDLTYMMGACTENEAAHYGRFISNILKTTAQWHSSAEIYAAQCEHYPGSIINVIDSEYISYDVYRDICYKWHYRLTRGFSIALESNNYIQIRNALIVMISIIDYYPAIKHFGKGIGIKVEEVRNSEKDNRQDLYALATAYAGRLDERRPNLIPESNFHIVPVDVKVSQKDARHSSSSSGSRKKVRT